MKKLFLSIFLIIFPLKSFALIEVDITRGNLNPLPIAVSPLSIDENSRKNFEKILKIKNIGSEISIVVEKNLKTSGLFNPLNKDALTFLNNMKNFQILTFFSFKDIFVFLRFSWFFAF